MFSFLNIELLFIFIYFIVLHVLLKINIDFFNLNKVEKFPFQINKTYFRRVVNREQRSLAIHAIRDSTVPRKCWKDCSRGTITDLRSFYSLQITILFSFLLMDR